MNRYSKNVPMIIFLLLFTTCLQANKGLNCIVLVDYSASLPNDEFDRYIGWFRQGLLKQLTFNDQIVIIPIDEVSERKNEIIGRCNFQKLKKQLSKNIGPYEILKKDVIIRARFGAVLDTLFNSEIYRFRDRRKQFNLLSDIIGALNQSTHYLSGPNTVIVIFSDMIQESPEANLTRLTTKLSIETKIRQLQEAVQIPDLKKSHIFICGATATTTEQYRLYQHFWTLFFNQANAVLEDYGYGNADRISDVINMFRK